MINKLNTNGFGVASLSTYDFSTLYTALTHNLIIDKPIDLIELTFEREGSDRKAFFTSEEYKRYTLWYCRKMCETLAFLFDNIYIRFDAKLLRQIVGIPMGTNYAPLVVDVFHDVSFLLRKLKLLNFSIQRLDILMT